MFRQFVFEGLSVRVYVCVLVHVRVCVCGCVCVWVFVVFVVGPWEAKSLQHKVFPVCVRDFVYRVGVCCFCCRAMGGQIIFLGGSPLRHHTSVYA